MEKIEARESVQKSNSRKVNLLGLEGGKMNEKERKAGANTQFGNRTNLALKHLKMLSEEPGISQERRAQLTARINDLTKRSSTVVLGKLDLEGVPDLLVENFFNGKVSKEEVELLREYPEVTIEKYLNGETSLENLKI